MPTSSIFNFSGTRVDPVRKTSESGVENVNLAASLTLAAGTIIGEVTASPGTFKAYASGNSDGTEIPKMVLQYACKSDASGNIAIGDQATGQWGQTVKSAPAWRGGIFNSADLTGLDANAVTVLKARWIRGNITDGGLLVIPGAS